MTTPPLATAAATIAICSGVTRTSNWPIADCAVCGGFRSVGEDAGRHGDRDRSRLSSKPNLLGLLAQRVVAEVDAELAEGGVARDAQRVRQRRWSFAVRTTAAEVVRQRGGRLRQVELGGAGYERVRLVASPDSSAAAAVTTLNVDPGG